MICCFCLLLEWREIGKRGQERVMYQMCAEYQENGGRRKQERSGASKMLMVRERQLRPYSLNLLNLTGFSVLVQHRQKLRHYAAVLYTHLFVLGRWREQERVDFKSGLWDWVHTKSSPALKTDRVVWRGGVSTFWVVWIAASDCHDMCGDCGDPTVELGWTSVAIIKFQKFNAFNSIWCSIPSTT